MADDDSLGISGGSGCEYTVEDIISAALLPDPVQGREFLFRSLMFHSRVQIQDLSRKACGQQCFLHFLRDDHQRGIQHPQDPGDPFRRLLRVDADIKAAAVYDADHGRQCTHAFFGKDRHRPAGRHQPGHCRAGVSCHFHKSRICHKSIDVGYTSVRRRACRCFLQIFQYIFIHTDSCLRPAPDSGRAWPDHVDNLCLKQIPTEKLSFPLCYYIDNYYIYNKEEHRYYTPTAVFCQS